MELLDSNLDLKEVQKLEGHTDRVWSLSFNPVSNMLASCSGDKTIRIWQVGPTGQWDCSNVLEDTHTRTVRSSAWSPCGKFLATGSFDATTAIWKYIAGDFECAATLEGHENEVKSVSWSASGMFLATCGRDKTVWVWEVQPGDEYECVAVLQGHSQDVKMVQWYPNQDLLVSVSYDNTIKVWGEDVDHEDWTCLQTLDEASSGHSSTVWGVSFNSEGNKMITSSDDLTMKIWESTNASAETGYEPWSHVCTLSGYHNRTIFSVDWSSEGVIASGAADDAICLFVEDNNNSVDRPSYKLLLKKEKAHDMDINSVKWNPKNSRQLASASDDESVKIWEITEIS